MKNLNLTLTPGQNNAVCDEILDKLRERLACQAIKIGSVKARKMEVDFIVGAMTALGALFPNDNTDQPEMLSKTIPPIWVVSLLSGRSLLLEE